MKAKLFGILSIIGITVISLGQFSYTYAADTFEIIPEAKDSQAGLGKTVDCVAGGAGTYTGKDGKSYDCKNGSVWSRYNNTATGRYKEDVGSQFATGIFSRNGVLDYLVYIIKFLSQLGLVIGAGMVIYTGYQYASAIFVGKSPSTSMIKNAIIGILIIIFSYAIMRILTSAFL